MKQSGLMLVIAGLLLLAFFFATDPRLSPDWARELGWSPNVVDAASDSVVGTTIGVIGSASVLLVGAWLVIRRAI